MLRRDQARAGPLVATTTSASRHHRREVGDLDAARARLLLRRGLGSVAMTRSHAGVVDERRDAVARGAEADLPDDRLVEPMPTCRHAAIAART